jgi:uncharacterized membrane protein YfcA
MLVLKLLAIGLTAGVFGGMFGIGGGLIIVPALLLVVNMKELNEAVGTSLAAQVLPVGLLGALEYYRSGFTNLRWAGLIAIGLFVGAAIGAKIMIGLPPTVAKRVYAGFLLAIGVRMMIYGK